MKSVRDIIFNIVNTNNDLKRQLATNPIDNNLAIYEIFGPQNTELPYLIYSVTEENSYHFGRNDCRLTFEIYTLDSTKNAELIKDTLLKIFDNQRYKYDESTHIYFHYLRDGVAFSELEEVIHHHLEFSFFYWRSELIDHLNTSFQPLE